MAPIEFLLGIKYLPALFIQICYCAFYFEVIFPSPFKHIVPIVKVGSEPMLAALTPFTHIKHILAVISCICKLAETIELAMGEMSLIPKAAICWVIVATKTIGHVFKALTFIGNLA